MVDIDLFIARNSGAWHRLEELTRRARRRGARNLTPAEVDELVSLYQRTSSHLSHARVAYRDPGLTKMLTTLVTQANGVVYRGGGGSAGGAVRDFFVWRFPAAVYQSGRFVAASAALLLAPALLLGVWLGSNEEALETGFWAPLRDANLVEEDEQEEFFAEEFEDYYSSDSAANFGTAVTVNNIQVGVIAFAGGILAGIPTVLILVLNSVNLGVSAAAMASMGQLDKFFGLVAPHGLLELTAVVIAGAAGLRMGWAMLGDPGDRPRMEAFGAEARRAAVIAVGVSLAFVVAGFIEGFVTGRVDDTWVRVGIGVVAEAAFLSWVILQGRQAVAAGLTGEVGELDRGWDELARARERSWAA